jgi:flavin reductase (DIM6/NTAB) family NADH-FMN oxidoreductase RutF
MPTLVSLDRDGLRRTFACFPSGVVAVCGLEDCRPVGLTVSTFVPVSLDPALVAFCIQRGSTTWPRLSRLSRMGVSVLGKGQETVARHLAGPAETRFNDVPLHDSGNGAVFIEGAGAWLDCSAQKTVRAGDHHIVVLIVHGLWVQLDVEPLVFHGSTFRELRREPVIDSTWWSDGWQ